MEAFPASAGDEYTPTLEEDPALGLTHRQKMEILFAVMLGLFLGALDQTIVGPALPTIATDLNGNDLYVWAITSYLLTSTISVPFLTSPRAISSCSPVDTMSSVLFTGGTRIGTTPHTIAS